MQMLDRIKQLMEFKQLSASQFADAMEVPRAVVSHVLSGRNKPSLDVVLKIASTYTDVSLEWLLLGKGEILTSLVAQSEKQEQPEPAFIETNNDDQTDLTQEPFVENVQYRGPGVNSAIVNKQVSRVASQVMIFYTDGTFDSFKPTV